MCEGFYCLKYALLALNTSYLILSFILISLGTYVNAASVVPSLTIGGGVITIGVFLLLVSLFGLYGTVKQHQIFLFFYMLLLFVIFVVQFFVAIACLAVNDHQIYEATQFGWNKSSNYTRCFAQKKFNCCGFDNNQTRVQCESWNCEGKNYCWPSMKEAVDSSLQSAGGVGLFFSFTEICGIWFALRFRNIANPARNPHGYF